MHRHSLLTMYIFLCYKNCKSSMTHLITHCLEAKMFCFHSNYAVLIGFNFNFLHVSFNFNLKAK